MVMFRYEPKFGFWQVIVTFIVADIYGNIMSLCLHRNSISVGASGALMGIYGYYMIWVIVNWKLMSTQEKVRSVMYMVMFFAINLMIGLLMGGVDIGAHLGGLLSGLGMGLLIQHKHIIAKLIGIGILVVSLVVPLFVWIFAIKYDQLMEDNVQPFPYQIGDTIKNQFVILKEIGSGSFGAIFSVRNINKISAKPIAMKLEKQQPKYSLIFNEVAVLRAMQGKPHFAKFYQCGTHQSYKFCTMELLGPCMIDIINRKLPLRFSLRATLKFGIQAIDALQLIHEAGFVHRDIKPGNFVIGNNKETAGIFYLIDFGLCKKLPPKYDRIAAPPRTNCFRGTLRYASLNAHNGQELGPGDDLLSLFFIMAEFYTGKLPWASCNDKSKVLEMKQEYLGGDLLHELPKEFLQIEKHILQLDFLNDPDYNLLSNIMKQIAIKSKIDLNQPFEWEDELDSLSEY
ncbi:MAG: putative Tau-tubulin kinase 2 [Streblomastix strix]|uniref:non-specific serine/threonine protein kinase n=1 Tax=Streblomastix strix TaxID=222440 RepID=A0A5J4VCP8_9EUKA|nr:MAG: putative Tau-tubulin kinase 2 [Streblomastix strix]